MQRHHLGSDLVAGVKRHVDQSGLTETDVAEKIGELQKIYSFWITGNLWRQDGKRQLGKELFDRVAKKLSDLIK